jgi:hypothetical protein
MALPVPRPFTETVVSAYMPDISTASSAFAVAPCRGRVVRVYSVLQAAITTADCNWTVEINGTAITGVAGVVAFSAAAAGDVDVAVPTAVSTTYVNEGDTIEFVSAGESSGTAPAMFYAVIERD